MKKNNLWTNIRILLIVLTILFLWVKTLSQYKIEYITDSIISPYGGNDSSVFNSFVNANHINPSLLVYTNLQWVPWGSFLEQKEKVDKAINKSKYFCLNYKPLKNTFSQSEEAKEILKTYSKEIVSLMGDKNFYDTQWEFWLPEDIVLVKNSSMLWISWAEFKKFFPWVELSRSELPKILPSEGMFTTGRWEFLWTSFPITAYGLAEIVWFSEAKNEQIEADWIQNGHMVYAIKKHKKLWNGLSIKEHNEKKLNELLAFFSLAPHEMTLNGLNVETEDIRWKQESQSARGYYTSIDEYLHKLEGDYQKIPFDKNSNVVILETEREYLWIFIDTDNVFTADYEKQKVKTDYLNQNYTIRDIYYFIDKSQFKLEEINKEDISQCKTPIQNNLFINK